MRGKTVLSPLLFLLASASFAAPQITGSEFDPNSKTISLTVETGVPLRVYLTKRLSKRLGEPVRAKLLEPLFAFDREVVPAGAEVLGRVSRLEPRSKMERTIAVLGGDFTSLHQAMVEFTTLVLPDGRQIVLHTLETPGLNSIVSLKPPKKTKPQKSKNQPANSGVLGVGKDQLRNQINSGINARTMGVAEMVRGPDKRERLEEFLLMKLPYHPQWVRKGTRFDAVLEEPLPLGDATVKTDTLSLLGSQPPPDSVVHARLVTPLNSKTAKQGERIQAVVTQPLFSSENKLILPEGARLTGAVSLVRPARWFHRGGRLRFNFEKIDLPSSLARPEPAGETASGIKTSASLEGAESAGKTAIKVDQEGQVKAVEPKTRLLAPALAGLIAAKSLDNDSGRVGSSDGNTSGRTLGGGSGLGLLGAVIAQSSHTFGSAMGFYGLGWSAYTNIVARGGEVEFGNNAAVDIRFGSRPPADSKLGKVLGKLGGS